MLSCVNFDFERQQRTSLPEAVYCQGKSRPVVLSLLKEFSQKGKPVLFTRLDKELFFSAGKDVCSLYKYDEVSRTAYTEPLKQNAEGSVAIVSAGTSDAFVAQEAAKTLEFLSIKHTVFQDCGVAGLWRLQNNLERINQHSLVIAIAGMEAALTSVLAGLTPRFIIGVPTSVGYGVCEGGKTALNSMLACCSPGVSVVNIDNGFGAACCAAKILCSFSK